MTNRYPGKCIKCGQTVHPNTGTCEKVGGKWVTTHTECPTGESPTVSNSKGLPIDWATIQEAATPNAVRRICCKCGADVGFNDGLWARSSDGKWYTWHADCDAVQATPQAATKTQIHERAYGRGSHSPRNEACYDLNPLDPMAERIS